MYADTERFYCFGCGLGGDVLDFVQRVENLSLPEAIQRLDGGPGLVPGPLFVPFRPGVPGQPVAPTGPGPADGGGPVLRRAASAQPRSLGVPCLAGRRP